MTLPRAFAFAAVLPLVAGCTGSVVVSSHPASTEMGLTGGAGGAGAGSTGDSGGSGGVGQGGAGGSGGVGQGGAGGGWPSSCGPSPCTPGQTMASCCGSGQEYTCVTLTCVVVGGCPGWEGFCETPLVISFDDAPVEYVGASSSSFSLGARRIETDWPTAKTPWLALDRNGNGRIDDGGELFGSMTVLGDGRRAVHGFEALRALDFDGDGLITDRDPAFAELVLWSDGDGDRRSTPGEIVPVAQAGIVSIDLRYVSDPRCDGHGNCEVERAPILYRAPGGGVRTGAVVDLHLAEQR